MANGAVSATVTLDGTKPVTTPASNGIGLDVEASLKQIGGTWPLGKKTLAMAEGTATPPSPTRRPPSSLTVPSRRCSPAD